MPPYDSLEYTPRISVPSGSSRTGAETAHISGVTAWPSGSHVAPPSVERVIIEM